MKSITSFLINIYRWIFARRIFEKFNLAVFHLGLRGLGVLNYESYWASGEKYLINKILPEVIENDKPVFFDVGANTGDYSKILLERFPDAAVYAFEPHPANYSRLQEEISSDKFKSYNIALGDSSGEFILYDMADCDGSHFASLHEAVISDIHKKEVVEFKVQVKTLDEFVESEGVEYIDFLKIDTEGHELAVLKGATQLLKDGKIKCIHFEFNEMNVVSGVFLRDFKNILSEYKLYRLLPDSLLSIDHVPLHSELFAYQNIIALPEKNIP